MITLPETRLRTVLAWAVILLTAGPIGIAVVLGVAFGESPCILCWAQRTSMVLMALTGLFVLRYGPRPRYLGTMVLLGAWGTFMAIRHSALHLARDVGQGFAASFFGAHTYVWSWVVHWVVLVVLAVLLLLLEEDSVELGNRELGRLGRFAMGLFVLVVAGNALQAFATTGPPPFMGQADPLRFSWNPSHWVWLADDELGGAISLRGSWTVPVPDPTTVEAETDPAMGPLAGLQTLPVLGWEEVGAPLNGRLTDLARDPSTGRFLAVTDRHGVFVLDAGLSNVEHRVLLDPYFAVDIGALAGAAFLGDTLALGTVNKSYLLLRPDPATDEDHEWRNFLETSGGVTELRRSRLATIRAKLNYVSSLAFDADANELVTVSVPSPRHRRMVVSRFDRRDFMLSSEFLPGLGPALSLAAADRRLDEYVVTGGVVVDGMLYAVSAAYSTLLVIDLNAELVTGAYAVPGLEDPVGIAVRGEELLIAQADGRIAVVTRPAVMDPAATVVARATMAMGGPEKLTALRSLRFRVLAPGGRITAWEINRPNQIRKERAGEWTLLFDGQRAGYLDGPVGEDGSTQGPHLVPEGEWTDFEMDIALYVPAFLEYPAKYLGETVVEGSPAHLLQVVLPLGAKVNYAVDAESWLPVMVTLLAWDYSLVVSGFQDFDGIRFPTRYWTPADPDAVTELVQIEVNPALGARRFAFPPAIR